MNRQKLGMLTLVLVSLIALVPVAPAAAQYEGVVDRAKPAVVFIAAKVKNEKDKWNIGTGFFVDARGYIVTARHVIEDNSRILVVTSSGREYEAAVERASSNFDAAILKINGNGFSTLRLGSSGTARIGQEILVLGYPSAAIKISKEPVLVVTRGIISAVHPTPGLLQIDAAANGGNSGGPVINRDGEVLGVLRGGIKDAQATNFAVAIDLVKTLTQGLIRDTEAQSSQPPSVQSPAAQQPPQAQAPGTPPAHPPVAQNPGAQPGHPPTTPAPGGQQPQPPAVPVPGTPPLTPQPPRPALPAPGTPAAVVPGTPGPGALVHPALIRPGSGIGPITLGMTIQQVVLAVGRPFEASGISSKGQYWWTWFIPGPTIRFTPEITVWARAPYGPIHEIRITTTAFLTPGGNRVGGLLDGFKAEFGEEYRVQRNLYLDLPVLQWPGMYIGFDPTRDSQDRRVVYIGVW